MLRDLLVATLASRKVPRDAIEYRLPAIPPRVRSTPAGVFIQQAGMIALERAGVDVAKLATRGTTMTRLAILDDAGSHPILEYMPAIRNAGPLPIFVPLGDLREAVARTAAPAPPMREAVSPSEDLGAEWTSAPCPGILARVVTGRLRKPGSFILWTGPRAQISVAPLPNGRLFVCAISRKLMSKDEQRPLCTAALNEAPSHLTSELIGVEGAPDDTWFPLEQIGRRACRSPGSNVLRWGSSALRLHPLTGQDISYWAIQSGRVADDFARNGAPSPVLFAQLDRDSARMYRQHVRAIAFHLAPSWIWRVLRRPYALAVRVTPPLRRRAVRRVALLDFLRNAASA
jgi:2-polyprenyl-6-methoxyphenol hydroxylase-like FAD-dependent oxidoreductase